MHGSRTSLLGLALLPLMALMAVMAPIPGPAAHAGAGSAGPLELDETNVLIEINDTDGDAGIHFFLDGEAWDSMTITGPDGGLIADIALTGSLAIQGLTEVFSESSEPSFEEQPLEEFLALFPAGTYHFAGTTTEGDPITGSAELTHALPDAPVLIAPDEGVPVDLNSVVVAWEPVPDPEDSAIVAYEFILEISEEPLRELVLDLPATVTAVAIPAALLEPESEYKFEVLAREESGNQTITEATFTTSAKGAETCLADLDGNAEVDVSDLLILLASWGGCS